MLFGVVPGLGAHVGNGAMVESEYCESQRKLGSTIDLTAKGTLWKGAEVSEPRNPLLIPGVSSCLSYQSEARS